MSKVYLSSTLKKILADRTARRQFSVAMLLSSEQRAEKTPTVRLDGITYAVLLGDEKLD